MQLIVFEYLLTAFIGFLTLSRILCINKCFAIIGKMLNKRIAIRDNPVIEYNFLIYSKYKIIP